MIQLVDDVPQDVLQFVIFYKIDLLCYLVTSHVRTCKSIRRLRQRILHLRSNL